MKKITGVFALVIILALLFTGCDLFGSSFNAADFVKGNIDSIYLGVHGKNFVDMVVDSEADLVAAHEEGLRVEADFFMQFFEIEAEYIPNAMINEIVELFREIYTHSKYEVGNAVKSGDTYLVSITIHPIDIIQNILENDFEPFLEDWYEMGDRGEFEEMSPEEFESKWARGIIDMIRGRMRSIGHLDPVTISVQVVLSTANRQNSYTIDEADFSRIDAYIIAYS